MNDDDLTLEKTRHWLTSMVIGLELCPFAEAVFKADAIRFAVCNGREPKDLLEALAKELQHLVGSSRAECETTLLMAPHMLPDFLDFNDFVGVAEQLLEDLDLSGVVQIVGFHPRFQFAETPKESPTNYTNRSPFPMLHLLREVSVTEATMGPIDLAEIPRRNSVRLEEMGLAKILRRQQP